ncbi:hypothetical protein I4U23_028127 [Adineta vaga]|nr:hypothetical protein I4U23_028127 [Adineta vaga]
MQYIPFYLFTILCAYSLIIAAPIKPVVPATEEAKHQKAHEIAGRLLKELAGEHATSNSIVESTNNKEEEHKDTVAAKPVNRPIAEKVEAHVGKPVVEDSYDEDNEDLELTPTIEDLYDMYNDKYIQIPDNDDETSSEIIDDEDDDEMMLPINREDLLKYLEAQEENEHSKTASYVPIMDDTLMTAEEHQQRRRRRSVY